MDAQDIQQADESSAMAVRNDPIFEQLLAPLFKHVLLDHDAIRAFAASQDWETAAHRLSNPQVDYPEYYRQQNFHGIANGYRSIEAAVSYDAITQYALPPNETWVRQSLIEAIQSRPMRILDLGCGTGSMTLMLKQHFPHAEVVGLDLSPYMLAVAAHRATATGQTLTLRHGNAETTGFADDCFDVVTIGLLCHELPTAIAQNILREAHRILRTGGEVLILDGKQTILRQSSWLTNIFAPPHSQDYAPGNLEAWLGAARFGAVRSQDVWLLHALARGVKGINDKVKQPRFADLDASADGLWATG